MGYTVNQPLIETLISWVKSGEIAIPEIQRPFVWSSTKVRDLMGIKVIQSDISLLGETQTLNSKTVYHKKKRL